MFGFVRYQDVIWKWTQFICVLLMVTFVTASSSFSDDIQTMTTDFELGPDATNATALEQAHHQLSKREKINRRSNVIYGETCSDAQVTYLDTALSEAGDMASRAFTAVDELLQIFRDREQPEHWPSASYTRRYRNLLLWGSFFGEPKVKRGVGKLSVAETIEEMQDVKRMYSDIKNALNVQRDGYHIEFNCDDDWAEFSHTNGEGYRLYRDMRFPDQNIEIILRASCRENAVAKAYSFINGISDREETVICPRSWALWAERGNGFIADFQSSSLAAMRGKKLQDLKDRAAAGTMLHEATHSERLMGTERATEDVQIQYRGETKTVYGTKLCRELAKSFTRKIGYPSQNADTLSYFALGVYYSQCNWANPTKPGFCRTDAPDVICPTVDGSRRCVTFDWNA